MFPLSLSDTLERVIVSGIISLAALALVRILFKSHKSKSGSCAKCDPE